MAAKRETYDPGRHAPAFEQILNDPGQSFRCHVHDYPCDLARWNYHPEHEIHLIRRSTGHVFVGDYVGTFAAGHLAFVNSNMPHNWVTELSGGVTVTDRDLVIQFEPGLLARAASLFPEVRSAAAVPGAFERSWQFHGETALAGADLMERVHRSSGLQRLALFLELLDLLARSPERSALATPSYIPTLDARASDLVNAAMGIVLEALPGEVSMSATAARLGLSPSGFSRFFKANTGHTFTDYIRKLRIGQACRLLSESDTPVTEICFTVGYANISNFNRSFRAERGMTPSAYRRRSTVKSPETAQPP